MRRRSKTNSHVGEDRKIWQAYKDNPRHADAKQCLGFDPYGWLEMRTCEHQFSETIRRNLLAEMGT